MLYFHAMNNKYQFLALVWGLLLSLASQAADGDTLRVSAHQNTDMTWYRSYRDWAAFPPVGKSWHKIELRYTMGCASGGCSDWDYTTLVNLLIPTGALDSSVASIDTLSTQPLVIDTNWRVFAVKERYELAKVITPYGGSLGNDWQRVFDFDISEFYPLLRDSVEIEVFYQGWSSGFSASLDFIFIEGPPVRPVYQIENLYRGQFNYLNSSQVESTHLPARRIYPHPQAQQFQVRTAPSGHGFINALNCAEFCEKDYYLKVNGQQVAQQAMWRNDCGLNALYPQAGTWLYDRANWCPGDRVTTYYHDLSAELRGQDSALVDLDIEPYSYTVPPGETPANYNMSAQLFHLGDFSHSLDAAVDAIIRPSAEDAYGRFNPVCHEAEISVQNLGAQPLNELVIRYGMEGQEWQTYTWTGQLAPLAKTRIVLPMDSLWHWTSSLNPLFFAAQIERVNGQAGDDYAPNNRQRSRVIPTPEYPAQMRFELRTNASGAQSFWELRHSDGSVIKSGDGLQGNTVYRDTFNLSPGCYQLYVGDRAKNGLSFFGNNDGSGRVMLRNLGGDFFAQSYNPNFGTAISDFFTVGYGINLPEYPREAALEWSIFPNPSQGVIFLDLLSPPAGPAQLSLYDMQGRCLRQWSIDRPEQWEEGYDLSALAPGFYRLELESAGQRSSRAVQIKA